MEDKPKTNGTGTNDTPPSKTAAITTQLLEPPKQILQPNTVVLDVIKYKHLTEPSYGNEKIPSMRDNVMIRAIKPPNSFIKSIRDVDEMLALLKLNSMNKSIQKANDAGKTHDERYYENTVNINYKA